MLYVEAIPSVHIKCLLLLKQQQSEQEQLLTGAEGKGLLPRLHANTQHKLMLCLG